MLASDVSRLEEGRLGTLWEEAMPRWRLATEPPLPPGVLRMWRGKSERFRALGAIECVGWWGGMFGLHWHTFDTGAKFRLV